MDTAKYSNGGNSNSQSAVIHLLVIGFIFVMSLVLTSCFESSSEDAPQPVESVPRVQTSEGQALYEANCAGCHGADGSTINGNTPDAITAAMNNIGTMNGISLITTEIQAISDFLTGNTGGGTGGSTGGGGGTSDGQALYTANCAGCHGADGSALTGRTGSQIAAAIVNVSTMTNVSLSGTEIQAIADFLSVTSDGQALYAANCSGCHGADGSTLAGRTGAQIAAAIVNVSTMMGVSLSGAEIIAIADFLSGGSGGGSTGGPPANHTNSEDGVLHAPGNTLPYSSGCTVCHGATLEGGVGPSCFACHAETWNESPPTDGGGTGGSGSTTAGQALYTTYCAACHGVTGTSLSGRTTDQISTAISSITTMNSIALSLTELQAIADYLSAGTGGGTGGSTGTGSGSGTVDGQALYTANCSVCHGADAATINDKTASGITAAMTSIGSMTGISLSAVEIQAISDYLTGTLGGGDTSTGGGTGSTSLPPNHTNSEEGVLHGEGNDAPYTNGCTTCHGATLEGGTGPSCFACHGVEWIESAPSSGGGGTSGGATDDGQALFTANCAGCHGITGSGINDKTASGITTAINNIVSMNSVSVTATEIQAISDFLTGSTGGTSGGGGTVDGQALFTANCSACHGATGSGINGTSVSAITAAISNIASMSNVSVTATEIQAISDFLTGSTGGSTGGGDTGGGTGSGLPANHTNSEEGVLHADGNNTPYTSGCTTCHGTTLQGGTGPSCFACHDVKWSESPPSGGDTGSGGGAVDGQALFTANCAACHGATGSGINDKTASGITTAISNITSMSNVSVTAAETQAISDFLIGSTGGSTGGTSGGGGTVDGQTLFTTNCAACHGATGSGINGTSVSAITAAISNIASMSNVSVTATEIQAISDFLIGGTGGSTGGGDTGSDDSGGPPASHTNPEDGILHAPGNNYPYSNGCTTCHGVTLEGAIGPSCFACHGQKWNESAPSDGGSTGGSTGGTTTTGQALFTTYCSACHGASGSNINGRTSSAISTAIANVGSMNSISLTSSEIQAIADYLAGSTGGGDSGSSGGSSSGIPSSHTNSEEGVPHAPGNDYPYTNGCTSCHGSTLQGGIGPSCYSCHGQEWRESGSGSSSDGSSGDGSSSDD